MNTRTAGKRTELWYLRRQSHLKGLRKEGIRYSRYYECSTKAEESDDGLEARRKRQEERAKRYEAKRKSK